MKIALTGARGGVGRALMAALTPAHEVTGIVRTPPTGGDGPFVGFADKPALAAALGGAEVVIHAALDGRAKGARYLDVNRALNREVLAGALAGQCRLYVFISSQVVYAGLTPAGPAGYDEDQPPASSPRLDAYTRLKIESEREAIAAAEAAGRSWLVVRPTIVMGPGMGWSDGLVRGARFGLPALGGRHMNLIHVDDLARAIANLVEQGVADQIVNLGGANVPSEDFFSAVGAAAGRRPIFLPQALARAAAPLLPSTFWFYGRDVTVSTARAEALIGRQPHRAVADMLPRRRTSVVASNPEHLKGAQLSPHLFRTHGQNYRSWFNPMHADDRVSLKAYEGVIALEGDRITVKAGTRLDAVSAALDAAGRALPTLPEFLGISAGACFFVDVHGSSREHFSLFELIEAVSYLDAAGAEVTSPRGDPVWDELRRRDRRFILTSVTFRTVPTSFLANRMVWKDDSAFDSYFAGAWKEHFSTTIQWYPAKRKLFVYEINPTDPPPPGTPPAVTPFRGLPYWMQKGLLAVRLRGKQVQVDRWHNILGPWRRVPFEAWVNRLWVERGKPFWCDMEMCMGVEDGRALIAALQRMIPAGELKYDSSSGIGIRFSRNVAEGRDYAWIELHSDAAQLGRVALMARALARDGVRWHQGKYVPPEISPAAPTT